MRRMMFGVGVAAKEEMVRRRRARSDFMADSQAKRLERVWTYKTPARSLIFDQ